MPNDSSDDERALLARLNALKKSNISLEGKSSLNAAKPAESSTANSGQDGLIHRFRNLNAVPSRSTAIESMNRVPELSHDEDEDDGKTVEELLAELGREEQWTLNPDEPNDIQKLLSEARDVLSQEGVSSSDAGPEQHIRNATNVGSDKEVHSNGAVTPVSKGSLPSSSNLTEDEEAARQLQQILDELSLEGETEMVEGVPVYKPTSPGSPGTERALSLSDLPRTPKSLPSLPSQPGKGNVPSALDLPSAPTTAPTTKSSIKSATSKLPQYSDKEIETWCVICNDDATVKCLGCEGDLYCAKCWKEGHIGKDAGFEERGHRWTVYKQA
ncbi:hypothetical protein MMC13_007396 [Lambiella insularis]|nr:hypothetical protein [Lambiella insularis]